MKNFFLLFPFFLAVSCESDSQNEERIPAPDNSIEIRLSTPDTLVFSANEFVPAITGYVTTNSGLTKIRFFRVDGGNKTLIEEVIHFDNIQHYDFSFSTDYNTTTDKVIIDAVDDFDQSVSKEIIIQELNSVHFSPAKITDKAAFPGAEGHGRATTGGRGARVYYVTNLKDDAQQGSLRWAINQTGPRTIVFAVSGTIELNTSLRIVNGDVTIAGQTAPGDGITLRNYPVSVDADNVIIRFLRFRMGDTAQQEGDALGGRFHKNIIVDHCSMSWSTDECVSFYQNENFTLQWCIIAESLRNSVHGKGSHGYGGIWGGKNASFHHNLMAHHDSRNPRLGEYNGDAFALTDLVDVRNNVYYNWQGNSTYGGEAMNVNIVNCYYKPGPATTKKERIVSIDIEKEEGMATQDIWGKFYIAGNYMAGSSRATQDNWSYGVFNQFHHSYGTIAEEVKESIRQTVPHNPGLVTTHSAIEAYKWVLGYAGASKSRDTVDARIVHDVETGTATFMNGGNGSVNGIIDTQEHVGGWPELRSVAPPTDTDRDGIPDVWEKKNGLNHELISDSWACSLNDNYTNLEVYLNSLVSDIVFGN